MSTIASPGDRICLVGAGPAGILTAWYLRERGFRDVVVLEKLGRVGGRARTIGADGRSFDLGANYVTPAYREIRRLARRVGATMYSERPFIAMRIPDDPEQRVEYSSMFDASRIDDRTGKKAGVFAFGLAVLRYVWIRWRLSSFIDGPSFDGVDEFQDGALCATLEEWLQANDLTMLRRVFELPSTLMGYGYPDEVAAIYILRFMSNAAFFPMVVKEMPLIGRFFPWPKRFTYGYQRFFERLAWDLDVRLNVDIDRIERREDGVTVPYHRLEQDLGEVATPPGELEFDRLILACPLNLEVVEPMLELSDEERDLFGNIRFNSYCMSTFQAEMGDDGSISSGSPLAAVYPVPPMDDRYLPYGVAKQWDDSGFVQVYTRTLDVEPDHPAPGDAPRLQGPVMAAAERVLAQMGAKVAPAKWAMRTFDRWPYFQHVEPDVMKGERWYTRLEALQGKDRTCCVGGATNFDLIEPIAEYARHLVAARFPGSRRGIDWSLWLPRLVAIVVALGATFWWLRLPA